MRNSDIRPPRFNEWMLKRLLRQEERNEKLGDLQEGYQIEMEQAGAFKAGSWYWFQILLLIPVFVSNYIFWSTIMIANYFKVALRSLWRQKTYSLINITGLAMGMAICALVYLWVRDELSFDRFHKNANELYQVSFYSQGFWWGGSPWALAPTLKNDYPEVQKCTRLFSRNLVVKAGDKSYYKDAALVDRDFLDMFTFPLIKGNIETAFPSPNSVLITETTARHLFGSEDPIGKLIIVNTSFQLHVTGVLQDVPANSSIQFDFLAPLDLLPSDWTNGWSIESVSYVFLDKSADLEDLRKKIADTAMKYDTRTDVQSIVDLLPVTKIHLTDLNGPDPMMNVVMFFLIAAFILIIACVNYMNLATARSGSRAKEICMRKVIGAEKRDIVRQFYSESFLSTALALVLALILASLFLPALNTITGKQLSLNLFKNPAVILGFIGIALVTGFLSGTYPALVISSFKPLAILKGAFRLGSYKSNIRRILVVGQFVATVSLIIMTAMISKQLHFILNMDLGLNKENVIILTYNNELKQNYQAFKNDLLQNPLIVSVTAASGTPTNIGNINPVYWEGKTSADYTNINFVSLDYDYFETFGMKILEGRDFSRDFSSDRTGYVINEEAAKLMNMPGSVVGKMFSIWQDEGPILGVVKNFHSQSLHSGFVPIVFTLGYQFATSRIFVRIRAENTSEAIEFIRQKTTEFASSFPFEYSFLDERIEDQYSSDERTGTLIRTFSILAVLISCLGVLGLASYMAEQRTKEIGIRKVLGASGIHIVHLITKEFLILVGVANLIAWPIAYYFNSRWLHNFAFHADMDIFLFLGSTVLSLVLALIAVSSQAVRAASVKPSKSLKYE